MKRKPHISKYEWREMMGQFDQVLERRHGARGERGDVNKKEIAKILRDYHWMINEIARQRKMMLEVNQSITGQYGIDGSMPHGKGDTSDPFAQEVIRREKKSKWIQKLERQVLFIQQRIHLIQDGVRKSCLNTCLMECLSCRFLITWDYPGIMFSGLGTA